MTLTQIPLTPRAAAGCSCCSPAAADPAGAAAPAQATTVGTWGLLGLTCGGCASRVAARLEEIDGVLEARVSPVAGGVSTAVVTSTRALAQAEVAAAVDRAGYTLAGLADPAGTRSSSCCSN
jgi:copper chaperone CopZ